MNIHEHQAKKIFSDYNVPVPRGHVAFSVDEAVAAAKELGGDIFVVKAQIHAGGRGKGGGVKLAKSVDEVKELSGQILGMQLVTHQTGPEGQKVRRLYIEEGVDIARELYFGMVVDRATNKVAVMASTEGGVEIGYLLTPNFQLQAGINAIGLFGGERSQLEDETFQVRTFNTSLNIGVARYF